jgi:hypothetical protein
MPQIGVWHLHGAGIEQLIRQGVSMAEEDVFVFFIRGKRGQRPILHLQIE